MWHCTINGGSNYILYYSVYEQRKKFCRLSLTDSMTGLLNRNGFNWQLEKYLEGNKQKNCLFIMRNFLLVK